MQEPLAVLKKDLKNHMDGGDSRDPPNHPIGPLREAVDQVLDLVVAGHRESNTKEYFGMHQLRQHIIDLIKVH